jgi:hypothetical protein
MFKGNWNTVGIAGYIGVRSGETSVMNPAAMNTPGTRWAVSPNRFTSFIG